MTISPAPETLFVRLYFDRHIIARLAIDLRTRGYDVLTTEEAGLDTASDEVASVPVRCAEPHGAWQVKNAAILALGVHDRNPGIGVLGGADVLFAEMTSLPTVDLVHQRLAIRQLPLLSTENPDPVVPR